MQNLPLPSLDAKAHSERLITHIKEACTQNEGKLSFKAFMKMALYEPGLGYYSAGNTKFGIEGDFITAPEISCLFGQSLSFALNNILVNCSGKTPSCILELGAGTGKLAGDILEKLSTLPDTYYILEVSADLIARQKTYLESRLKREIFKKIHWLTELPSAFEGVILANEVIDAMPVHKIKIESQNGRAQYYESYVTYDNNGFQWLLDKPSPELTEALSDIMPYLIDTGEYISEINTDLKPWLKGLSDCLTQGVMIFIDYGFPAHEYYHPDRSMGTLMCHYRHLAHDNVFEHIGLSDITAHVDFTALAYAAHAAHLEVAGFTTQAAYLLDNQLAHFAEKAFETNNPLIISQQVQQLTSPQEMGELFKVMALTKNWDHPLTGFSLRDHRSRL